jgi:hypothetical protein
MDPIPEAGFKVVGQHDWRKSVAEILTFLAADTERFKRRERLRLVRRIELGV